MTRIANPLIMKFGITNPEQLGWGFLTLPHVPAPVFGMTGIEPYGLIIIIH